MKKKNSTISTIIFVIVATVGLIINNLVGTQTPIDLSNIPEFSGEPYIEINNNVPSFEKFEITDKGFESYSELDYLGRCGSCIASVGIETMPTEERGNISHIKPTGWQSVQYDNVDQGSLYNRCHLIGFQLTGENANEENLITGTRYMNVEGMLPFENMIAEYVLETGNHVMYRVTPIFEDDNLLANGVNLEAYSVEDNGSGVSFNVYCYNVQPDIYIDYTDGDNYYNGPDNTPDATYNIECDYVLNNKSMKFHIPDCSGVENIGKSNRKKYTGTREDLIDKGYKPCGTCNP